MHFDINLAFGLFGLGVGASTSLVIRLQTHCDVFIVWSLSGAFMTLSLTHLS